MPEILLCGAEGEQFLFVNDLDPFGADDKRRGSVKLLAGDQMFRQFDTGYADFWVHFRCAPTDTSTSSAPTTGEMMFISSGGTKLARVFSMEAQAFSDNDTIFFRFDAATDETGSMDTGVVVPHANSVFVNYDIRVRVTTVTNPNDTLTVDFYRNEVLRRTVTSTDAGGFPLPDSVTFNARVDQLNEDDMNYQDVVVTDALPTVGMELATLVPSAVGNFSEFTNDYTAIDDTGYDQSTTISTTAADQRESWFFADPEFTLGDKVIYGVAITTVAQLDLAGVVADFKPFVRIGAINYDQAGIGADNVAPNAYVTLITTNPSTSAPWQEAELIGLESGLLSI